MDDGSVGKFTSWTHSKAEIIALMLPVHSTLLSTPPSVISAITYYRKVNKKLYFIFKKKKRNKQNLRRKGFSKRMRLETHFLNWFAMFLWVHKLCHTKLLCCKRNDIKRKEKKKNSIFEN